MKKIINKIKQKIVDRKYKKMSDVFDCEVIELSKFKKELKTRNAMHMYAYAFYEKKLPKFVKEHREYFKRENRGFGEDAFHTMWWLLMKEYKPKKILEIGVYRGQVITLLGVISNEINHEVEIYGLSPFTNEGDSVSDYTSKINYYDDVMASISKYKIEKQVTLWKNYSNDAEGSKKIKENKWDLVYIDGNHEYEVAKLDYENSLEGLNPGGLMVIDDASLYTDFIAPSFSFKGHPGPSRICSEIAMKEMKFIAAVGHNNIFQKI